jgi:NAD-dependent deacetylase
MVRPGRPGAAGLDRAAELVAAARRGVAFTGAGISQESGIQTYRGQGGLWNTTSPRTSSIEFFIEDPAAYWTVARERGNVLLAARPNAAHEALVELERRGRLVAVVTQNVDGLHKLAGSREVLELHGNGREVVCLDCGNREPRSHVQARLDEELPPRCLRCGGIHMKPAAVFFGEAMPVEATRRSFQLAAECDLMLVVGSSLVVYSAAQVPLAAHEAGAPLVIVNAEPTPFDELATVILRGRAGELLPELARLAAAQVKE